MVIEQGGGPVMEIKPIVVGIEDNQPSAVRFAAEAAAQRGAELRVVHCLEGTDDLSPWDDNDDDSLDLEPTVGQDVLDAAQELIEAMPSPPRTQYLLGAGSPYETLLTEASQASLVVVGTDSVGRMDRFFDGTVTEYLVKHAPIPVAIVPEQSWPLSPGAGVVLALDTRAMASGPIHFAFEEANRRDAELHVTHVAPPGMTSFETSSLRTEIAEILAGWPQRYPRVKLTRGLTHGSPDEGCIGESAGAELLVLGRGNGRLRHPVLTQLARRAQCPCIVVPETWSDSSCKEAS